MWLWRIWIRGIAMATNPPGLVWNDDLRMNPDFNPTYQNQKLSCSDELKMPKFKRRKIESFSVTQSIKAWNQEAEKEPHKPWS